MSHFLYDALSTKRLKRLKAENKARPQNSCSFFRHRLRFFLTILITGFFFSSHAFAQFENKTLESLSPEEISKAKALLEKQDRSVDPKSGSPKNKEPLPPQKSEPINKDIGQTPEVPSRTKKNGSSQFEDFIRGDLPTSISLNIEQFGYELFRQAPSSFTPVDALPVGPDYLLGPGDELRIDIWGKVNAAHTVVVDRDGKIVLPQFGTLHLAGLSFSESKTFIKKAFSRFYDPSEVKMNVSMGQLRSIRVFVVGKAKHPGSYTLSSFSSLINALLASGGPSKVGSMRNITVKRKGETLVQFDLYDLLLKGDKRDDIRLMPEDVIFIPTVGPLIGIAGNVRAPAVYESKGEMTLQRLIEMAGGISATGYLQQIQVERIFDNDAKTILDIDLSALSENKDLPLMDGDLVKVFSINFGITNAITLKGNVNRPGKYEWYPGMRVRDLIPSLGAFLPDTYFDFALIERLVPPDNHQEYLSIALGDLYLNGVQEKDILLQPHDNVSVFNRFDFIDQQTIHIEGAVNKPGPYAFRPNMKLSDLLNLSGGPKDYAFLDSAELTRITPVPDGPRIERMTIDLNKAISGDPDHNLALRKNDHLSVQTVPEWSLYRRVQIEGEVRFPGSYTAKKGETLSSLIERAGGYTDNAYLKGAIFTRESVRALQQKQLDDSIDRLEHQILSESAETFEAALSTEASQQHSASIEQRKALIIKMRAAKAKGRMAIQLVELDSFKITPSNITLEDGDHLIIPERAQQVQVIGAVYNQTAFIYDPDTHVSHYLEKAGGLTENANEKTIYVLKVDGTAVSKQQTKGFWKKGLLSQSLDPGDTIVVPAEIGKIAWLREVKDITQILYQIAVTAGVLIVAF